MKKAAWITFLAFLCFVALGCKVVVFEYKAAPAAALSAGGSPPISTNGVGGDEIYLQTDEEILTDILDGWDWSPEVQP